jgi:hypothetical protein
VGLRGCLGELPAPPGRVTASGLAGMAVGAKGHHVARMILAASRQILDVVDVQDWLATPVRLDRHPRTAGALAATAGADEHRPPGGRAARVVGSHHPAGASRLAALVDARNQGGIGRSGLGLRSSRVITSWGGGGVLQGLDNLAWPLLGGWPWDRLEAPLKLLPWPAVLAHAGHPGAPKHRDPGKEREAAAGGPVPEPHRRLPLRACSNRAFPLAVSCCGPLRPSPRYPKGSVKVGGSSA